MYLTGSIGRTMLKTAVAMLPATLAISGYNLADTWFVGHLGVLPLAAMSYTFPVVFLIGCIFRGVAVGTMTPAAHALGAGRQPKAARTATSGLALNVLISMGIAVLGIALMQEIFSAVGARGAVLPLISQYMTIWYAGCVTGVMTMVCNDLIIAAGSPRIASSVMLGGLGLNIILDPIMIFGWGGFPALGLKGAALATVLSQFAGLCVLLVILHRKFHLLTREIRKLRILLPAWKTILHIAVPSALGMILIPIGNGVVTRAVASFGEAAVAGAGAAGRLESIAFLVPMSLGIALMPMVAQNYGAKNYLRIDKCRKFSLNFAGWYLLGMAVICVAFARPFAGLFTDDPEVIGIMTRYLRIIAWGFGMNEIHRYCTFFLTGCNHPRFSACLNALRVAVFLIPFTLLAAWAGSLNGIFAARLAADVTSGIIGILWVRAITKKLRK